MQITEENALKVMGDSALGLITALHYGPYVDNAQNKQFVAAYKANPAWGPVADSYAKMFDWFQYAPRAM